MNNLRKMAIHSRFTYLPALLALGWLTGAWGDALSDPTAPPPAWLAEHPPAPSVAGQGASSGVHLMLIGKSRKFALIDGQVVKPGDAYNGSKVLAIKPDKVVVQDESRSLALTPTSALIDGQGTQPGDTYKGSKALPIKPDKVGQGGPKSLALVPTVEKKVIRPAKQKKTTKASSNKELVNGGVQ